MPAARKWPPSCSTTTPRAGCGFGPAARRRVSAPLGLYAKLVLMTALWGGEPVLASMVIGGLLVIAGVALTNRPALPAR